jgi:hypothetical protein
MTAAEIAKTTPLVALREIMQELWDKSTMEGTPLACGGAVWRAANSVLIKNGEEIDYRSFEEREATPLTPQKLDNCFIESRFCKVS